ncbi:MAG: GTP-binding protein, partial [[Eubacterium] rectale]|nr:GTP-binding protein [Agathobacter rectalis]
MFTYYNNVREVLEMNVYTTEKIRNVVLLGHSGCGKTSLVEAMAYLAGQTTRMGTVADGSTISDFDKEEIKRQFSIHTSVIPIEWDNVKINILDTPGFFDFVGEVEEAVSAADAAIIVVSGKAGIQTGTKRAWEICEKYKLPRMIFVTDMDIDNASFKDVVLKLQELYGKKIAPFHLPIRENEKFVGYVNVIQQRAKRWNESGGVDKFDVPEYSKENLGMKYLPSPEKRSCTGINTKTNEVYNADYDFAKSKSAYVFKSIVDPYIGKYSLIKVNSGVLKTDDVLYNYHRDCDEKIGKLYVMRGSKVEEVKELHAGDIGALAKLTKTLTTDSLSTRNMPVTYLRTSISKPYVAMRYKAKKKGDEDKISQSLQKLLMEDLTLNSVNDSENGQTVLYGIGDMQLEVVASELLEKY